MARLIQTGPIIDAIVGLVLPNLMQQNN